MTGFTVPLGFPYPTLSDPLDGPGQIQALAEAVDDVMVTTLAAAQAALAPPAAKITGTAQPTVSGLGYFVQFNSVYYDNDGMADLVADPASLTVQTAGVYAVSASITFSPNSSGYEEINLLKNGTGIAGWASAPVNSTILGLSVNVPSLVSMAVGDKFGMTVVQVTGAAVSVFDAQLTAVRISS